MSTNTSFQLLSSSDKSLHFFFISFSFFQQSNKSMMSLFQFLAAGTFSPSLHFFLPKAPLCVFVSLVSQQCRTQALTSCWFISSPSSPSLLPGADFFLLGSRPRASASSKVVVRGLPRVSGNNSVSTPIMNARIPTMSYMGDWWIKEIIHLLKFVLLSSR